MSDVSEDSIVLRVKSSSDVQKVGFATAKFVEEGKQVHLRAVGAGAINQAQKAVAVASGYLATRGGMRLATVPGFTEISGNHGEQISAMTFQVVRL